MDNKGLGLPLLELRNVNSYYGRSHIIQGLDLFVNKNESVSILGRNGVGKTTTLRTVMGFVTRCTGQIILNGEEITGLPAHKVARKGVAYVPAERHIFPGVRVEENLLIAKRESERKEGWDLEKVYTYFPVLKARRNQDGSTLSGGEQQMLAIGRALISNPLIMLLDEPSQGLAPLLVFQVIQPILIKCIEAGLTLLLVEQNHKLSIKVASRHYLMGIRGIISRVCTSEELISDPEIIRAHLSV